MDAPGASAAGSVVGRRSVAVSFDESSTPRTPAAKPRVSRFSLRAVPADLASIARSESQREDLETVTERLQEHILFQQCDPMFVQAFVSKSEYSKVVVAPGETFELEDEDSLMLVLSGAVTLRVGDGEAVDFAPGTVLNSVGFCGLWGASNTFRPRRRTFKEVGGRAAHMTGYEPASGDEVMMRGPPPQAFRDRVHEQDSAAKEREEAKVLPNTALNFYSTVPYGALHGSLWYQTDFMEYEIQGKQDIGATLLVYPSLAELLESPLSNLGAAERRWGISQLLLQANLDIIRERCEKLTTTWRHLMKALPNTCFPACPAEVVFWFAMQAEEVVVKGGGTLCAEGEDLNGVYILTEGFALVRHRVPSTDRVASPKQEIIGSLRPGAVIGDICLMGLDVLRAASVIGQTDIRVLRLSEAILSEGLALFPGILSRLGSRQREVQELLMEQLPTRTEVVRSLRLFSLCDTAFVSELGSSGERRSAVYGEIIVKQGEQKGTMHVLELGRCIIQVFGDRSQEVPVGHCFGEKALLGVSKIAPATVRVSTPIACIFSLTRTALTSVMEAFPEQERRLERALSKQLFLGRVHGSMLRNLELFEGCQFELLEDLGRVTRTRCYMAGQAVIVEGDIEENPKMFVLVGGKLAVEAQAEHVAMLRLGAAFGELAFLGKVCRRTVTIRAVTTSLVIDIDKTDFMDTIAKYAEDRERIFQRLQHRVDWPCFRGVDSGFCHLLDLHADRKKCAAGCLNLQEQPLSDCALLVQYGQIVLLDDEGNELEVLQTGMCFNEQVFAGHSPWQKYRLVPRTECEVRALSREQICQAIAEFPDEQSMICKAVLRYAAEQSERRLGHRPASVDILCGISAFFDCASEDVLRYLRDKAEPRMYEPGVLICGQDDTPPCTDMFIMLSGDAEVEDPFARAPLAPGQAFGEAVMLGVVKRYPGLLATKTSCVFLALRRKDVEDALKNTTRERNYLDALRSDALHVDFKTIRDMLAKAKPFRDFPADAIAAMCPRNNVKLFAPGAIIIEAGERCEIGITPFHLVLAGEVVVEGSEGTVLATIKKGHVIGESAAWGLSELRTATCRASRDGIVACACISGLAVLRTRSDFPEVQGILSTFFARQVEANRASEERRHIWLRTVAIPALSNTWLLKGCSEGFLHQVAVNIPDGARYEPGEVVVAARTKADGMLVVLSGSCSLELGDGQYVGELPQNAVCGEVAALGLFDTWMVTVRARTKVIVMEITEDALWQAAAKPEWEEQAKYLRRVSAMRHDQVAAGSPLASLGIGASSKDLSTRIVSLLAQKVTLRSNRVWIPAAADSIEGPQYFIVISGQAAIVLGAERDLVMSLPAGSIVPEALLAEYNAEVKALTSVNAYRIRLWEFEVAVTQDSAAQKWIWGFRLREKDSSERVRSKLRSFYGYLRDKEEHPLDDAIKSFCQQRDYSTKMAGTLRGLRGELSAGAPRRPTGILANSASLPSLAQLPSLRGADACEGSTSRSSWYSTRSQDWRLRSRSRTCSVDTRGSSQPGSPTSLPSFRRAAPRRLAASRSEPLLPKLPPLADSRCVTPAIEDGSVR